MLDKCLKDGHRNRFENETILFFKGNFAKFGLGMHNQIYSNYFKRPVDFLIAIIGLVIFSPLLAIVYLIVRVFHGSPVIFIQERPGLNGELFSIYKFRTMVDLKDSSGNLLGDEERITRLGNFLRNSSLDELPELWNVVIGDMGLVGPRPLRVEYLPIYTSEQARRHNVRPGITGWAQVNGRNSLSWEERFILDVWYVENVSFILDLKILFFTIVKVFSRKGISAEGYITMPRFTGTRFQK